MLKLVHTVKKGMDPHASKALNELFKTPAISSIINRAAALHYPFFKDRDVIKSYAYESVWIAATKFTGKHEGQFINYCKKSIKTKLLITQRDMLRQLRSINAAVSEIDLQGRQQWLDQHDTLLERIARKEVFLKVYDSYIEKRGYRQILAALLEDPYISSPTTLVTITGKSKQNIYKLVGNLKKSYGGILNG